MNHPTYTLLLLKSDAIARADFSAGPRPNLLHVQRAPRPPQSDCAELVRAALALGGKCGRNVWVLYEDLWTQVLSFPAVKLAGLAEAQLVRAFAFEAEPLSGISGLDAVAGYVPAGASGDRQACWVTLTDAFTRDRIQAEVRKAGGKLCGLVHPAGVPAPLAPLDGNESWSRVEVWHQITLCLGGRGAAIERLEIVNAGSTQARAQASVSAWMAGENVRHCELLEAHEKAQLAPALDNAKQRLALSSEQDLTFWLAAWMRALAAPAKNAPVIRAAPVATPQHLFVLTGIAAELLIVGLCALHWHYTAQAKQQITSALDEYRGAAQHLADIKKKAEDAKKESDKLALENDKTEALQTGIERDFAQQRGRILLLLENLAQKRPPDTVIQRIAEDSSGVLQIQGTTLEASNADQLALDLSSELASSGWGVRPLEKEGGKLLADGGPWQFTLDVSGENAAQSPLKNPAATGGGRATLHRGR